METPSSRDDRSEEPEDRGQGPEPDRSRGDAPQEEEAGTAPRSAEDTDRDPFAPLIAEEDEDEDPLDAEEAAEVEEGEESRERRGAGAAGGSAHWAGLLSTETFAAASVLAVAAALVGPRLVQMFATVTAPNQVAVATGTIVGDTVTALFGVVLGLVALGLAEEDTRPWARWWAGAAVLIGLLFTVLSLIAFTLVPPPAPAGPPM
ncbi:hypothetical protein FZ103_02835 [Streptomonospora sp. PA3]|uniref:hypothetical protein n=1 Tax=Streptomonospora sp. PA3 TaxID=2607326 RepID=UPI0012DC6D22|nr:hypothetical protein [Streptomonospora sp. PA3]MUL40121.1 hypothetical protein [Streptomonospora sp. PA3]